MEIVQIILKILLHVLRIIFALSSGVFIYKKVPELSQKKLPFTSHENSKIAIPILAFMVWMSITTSFYAFTDYDGYQLVQLAKQARKEGLVIKPKKPRQQALQMN